MYIPSRMFFQFVEHSEVAVFKDEVQLLFAPENLDQIHQVWMFQLLRIKNPKVFTRLLTY